MKMVQAIIRPERLDSVKKSLEEKGFIAMSVIEMRGRGNRKAYTLNTGEKRWRSISSRRSSLSWS